MDRQRVAQAKRMIGDAQQGEGKRPFALRPTASSTTGTALYFCLFFLIFIAFFDASYFTLGLNVNADAVKGATVWDNRQMFVGLIVYPVAFFSFLKSLSRGIAFLRIMWPLVVLILFSAASMLWSLYPLSVLAFSVHSFCLLIFCVALAMNVDPNRERLYTTIFWSSFLVCTLSILSVCLFPLHAKWQPASIWQVDGPQIGRWKGITGQPNELGMIAFLLVWSSLAVRKICTQKTIRRLALIAIPMALGIVAFGANSVTALGACLVMLAYDFVFPLGPSRALSSVKNQLPKSSLVRPLIIVLLLAFSAVLLLIFKQDLWEDPMKLVGRSSNLTGRTELWIVGLQAMMDRPLLGWSFDYIASVTKALNGAMQYGHFHNGFVDLGVRGGITAWVLFFFVLAKYIFASLRLKKANATQSRLCLVYLFGFLVENVGEAQIFQALFPVWVVFVIVWATAEADRRSSFNSGSGEAAHVN